MHNILVASFLLFDKISKILGKLSDNGKIESTTYNCFFKVVYVLLAMIGDNATRRTWRQNTKRKRKRVEEDQSLPMNLPNVQRAQC